MGDRVEEEGVTLRAAVDAEAAGAREEPAAGGAVCAALSDGDDMVAVYLRGKVGGTQSQKTGQLVVRFSENLGVVSGVSGVGDEAYERCNRRRGSEGIEERGEKSNY